MLSDEELQVLRATEKGHTVYQTSRRTGLTVARVKIVRTTFIHKLGGFNKTHAVAIAIRKGVI